MKDRGLSKDEAFMVETAQSAELVSQHKNKKEKHKAAFGGVPLRFSRLPCLVLTGITVYLVDCSAELGGMIAGVLLRF